MAPPTTTPSGRSSHRPKHRQLGDGVSKHTPMPKKTSDTAAAHRHEKERRHLVSSSSKTHNMVAPSPNSKTAKASMKNAEDELLQNRVKVDKLECRLAALRREREEDIKELAMMQMTKEWVDQCQSIMRCNRDEIRAFLDLVKTVRNGSAEASRRSAQSHDMSQSDFKSYMSALALYDAKLEPIAASINDGEMEVRERREEMLKKHAERMAVEQEATSAAIAESEESTRRAANYVAKREELRARLLRVFHERSLVKEAIKVVQVKHSIAKQQLDDGDERKARLEEEIEEQMMAAAEGTKRIEAIASSVSVKRHSVYSVTDALATLAVKQTAVNAIIGERTIPARTNGVNAKIKAMEEETRKKKMAVQQITEAIARIEASEEVEKAKEATRLAEVHTEMEGTADKQVVDPVSVLPPVVVDSPSSPLRLAVLEEVNDQSVKGKSIEKKTATSSKRPGRPRKIDASQKSGEKSTSNHVIKQASANKSQRTTTRKSTRSSRLAARKTEGSEEEEEGTDK